MTKDQAMIHVLMKKIDELELEIGRLRNNSIIIPKYATNRDMFKLVFGEEIYNKTALRIGWLNEPYKKGVDK